MKIVNTAPMPSAVIEGMVKNALDSDVEFEVVAPEERTKESLLDVVKGASIIVGDYTFEIPIDAEVIDAAGERCILIHQPSVGYQQIDTEHAARKSVPVANAGGSNDIAVAEHTVMVGLALLKNLFSSDKGTRAGEWPQLSSGGVELFEKTWGIVGFGRIGREVARRLRPFGPRILYYDVYPADEKLESELGVERSELDPLLVASDVVSLHVPLTPETRGMIGAAELAKIGGYLVNVARGEVVVESDLVDALRSKKLAGAAIDVYETEPVPADSPLLELENVILTPHTAGVTAESRRRIMRSMVDNLVRVLKGEQPVSVVNGV